MYSIIIIIIIIIIITNIIIIIKKNYLQFPSIQKALNLA